MARINIEEQWWSDPRRMKLLLKIGFQADSAAVNMWRTAQEYWGRGRKLIPKKVFDGIEFSTELLAAGLAENRGDEVYVSGSSSYLDWVHEKREKARAAGKRGGKKSAKVRQEKYGTAIPNGAKNRSATEAHPEANSSAPKPSDSDSDSDSGSSSLSAARTKKNEINHPVNLFDSNLSGHPDSEKFVSWLETSKIASLKLRRNAAVVMQRFGGFEAFEKFWAENTSRGSKISKLKSPDEIRRYATVMILKESGLIAEEAGA